MHKYIVISVIGLIVLMVNIPNLQKWCASNVKKETFYNLCGQNRELANISLYIYGVEYFYNDEYHKSINVLSKLEGDEFNDINYYIGYSYSKIDNDFNAIKYLKKYLINNINNESTKIKKTFDIITNLFIKVKKIDDGIIFYNELLSYLNLDKKTISIIYKKLIVLYENQQEYSNMIEYYKKLFNQNPEKYFFIDILIGTAYANNGEFKKALNSYKMFLEQNPIHSFTYIYIDIFEFNLILDKKLDEYYEKLFLKIVNKSNDVKFMYKIIKNIENILNNNPTNLELLEKSYSNMKLDNDFFDWLEKGIVMEDKIIYNRLINFIKK